MNISKEAQGAAKALRACLPLPMPREAKDDYLDIVLMNAAYLAEVRGSAEIGRGDIGAAMFRFGSLSLMERCARCLGAGASELAAWKAAQAEADGADAARVSGDVARMAALRGADYDEAALRRSLEAISPAMDTDPFYVKTTTKPGTRPEMTVRSGNPGRVTDYAALIGRPKGLRDLPSYGLWEAFCRAARPQGTMADIGLDGELRKLCAFFKQRPMSLANAARVPGAPRAIKTHAPLLRSLGFRDFGILGVDFVNDSVNLYFHPRGPGEIDAAKVGRLFSELGFAPLPEGHLSHIGRAGLAYFTFREGSERVERVCFTTIFEDGAGPFAERAPGLGPFLRESPLRSHRRNLIAGFAYRPDGHFLKAEFDYKASLYLPRLSSFSGLLAK
jgi:aromatic prenyltransferase